MVPVCLHDLDFWKIYIFLDDWMSVTLITSVFSSNYIYQNYFGIGTAQASYVTIFSLCRQQQLCKRKKINCNNFRVNLYAHHPLEWRLDIICHNFLLALKLIEAVNTKYCGVCNIYIYNNMILLGTACCITVEWCLPVNIGVANHKHHIHCYIWIIATVTWYPRALLSKY